MPRLTIVTYNAYRERKGRDAALDGLLEEDALFCLQEVGISRARELKRRFERRTFLSQVMYYWQFLALVLPEDAIFLERRTVYLNSYSGFLPVSWSLRRVRDLYRAGRRHGWSDGLSPRAVQVARISWRGREFQVMNTHLPYEPGLRDRCLTLLPDLVGEGDVLFVGDLNATPKDLFMNDLLLSTGLEPAGPSKPTHNSRRRIDYVLYKGGFREVGYGMKRGKSDHRLVRVELEVL